MEKVLISLPGGLATKFRAVIPARQRSVLLARLIETEIKRREKLLYQNAIEVEKDTALNREMASWDVTLLDGLEGEKNESW